jgi:hypothetical protein
VNFIGVNIAADLEIKLVETVMVMDGLTVTDVMEVERESVVNVVERVKLKEKKEKRNVQNVAVPETMNVHLVMVLEEKIVTTATVEENTLVMNVNNI